MSQLVLVKESERRNSSTAIQNALLKGRNKTSQLCPWIDGALRLVGKIVCLRGFTKPRCLTRRDLEGA